MSTTAQILVTGATGTVGKEVVAELAKAGARVRAATRDPGKFSQQGVEPVAFDYDSNDSVDAALRGVERLFLVTPPLHAQEVEHGQRLVERARAAGVRHIVKLSAIGVENFDDAAHRKVEKAVEASGIGWTHLRPNFFMQNLTNFSGEEIRSTGRFALAAADGKASYVDTRDVGAVGARALLEPEKWNRQGLALTGPAALDHHEIARIFSEVTGKKVEYVSITDEQLRAGMKQGGAPDYAIEVMSMLYNIMRAGWAAMVTGEVEKVLGRPAITFQQFARDYASALK